MSQELIRLHLQNVGDGGRMGYIRYKFSVVSNLILTDEEFVLKRGVNDNSLFEMGTTLMHG